MGSLSRNLQIKVECLDTALQDAGKISVTWRRLSIFLLILLVFIVASTIITLVVLASKRFATVRKLYVNLNGTTEEKYETMTKFVREILKEKEAEFDAEREQDQLEIKRMRNDLESLRDEFARNQSGLETRIRA